MSKIFISVQQHVFAFISQSWKGERARKHKETRLWNESVDGGVTVELKLRHITNKANNVEYLQSEWHTEWWSPSLLKEPWTFQNHVGSTVGIVHPVYFGFLTNNITKLVEVRLCFQLYLILCTFLESRLWFKQIFECTSSSSKYCFYPFFLFIIIITTQVGFNPLEFCLRFC